MRRLSLAGGEVGPKPLTVEAARVTSTLDEVTLARVKEVRSPTTVTLCTTPVSRSLTVTCRQIGILQNYSEYEDIVIYKTSRTLELVTSHMILPDT